MAQTTATPAHRAEVIILSAAALTLPTLSMIPLGGLYLYEKGWLIYWAMSALLVIATVYGLLRLKLDRQSAVAQASAAAATSSGSPSASPGPDGGAAGWSPAERQAWTDVRTLAHSANADTVTDPDAAWALAMRTIDTVARRLKPGNDNAVWHFTVPEALLISERVSRRLNRFVATHVPFGDRLTVSQMLALYRARGLGDIASKAYDVWRIVRLANPAAAVTNEVRERLTKAVLSWGRDQVSRRLVEAYVEEVGRAAIDLYGGRLGAIRREAIVAASPDAPPHEPRPGRLRQLANAIRSLRRPPKS